MVFYITLCLTFYDVCYNERMKAVFRSILITILSILLLSWLTASVSVANTLTLVIAGTVLALLNSFLRPLLKVLFLPINLITLGLFGWLINILMIYLAMWLVPGFEIAPINLMGIALNQFWSVVLVSILLSFVSSLLGSVL